MENSIKTNSNDNSIDIDFTDLRPEATEEDIKKLCDTALKT